MIQRKQTIWLLLAAITGFLITRVPLYAATLGGETVRKFIATENLLLFAVAIIAALLGLVAVFLFKNRPLQMKLSVLGVFVLSALLPLKFGGWASLEEKLRYCDNKLPIRGVPYYR